MNGFLPVLLMCALTAGSCAGQEATGAMPPPGTQDMETRRQHWAWQPLTAVATNLHAGWLPP